MKNKDAVFINMFLWLAKNPDATALEMAKQLAYMSSLGLSYRPDENDSEAKGALQKLNLAKEVDNPVTLRKEWIYRGAQYSWGSK